MGDQGQVARASRVRLSHKRCLVLAPLSGLALFRSPVSLVSRSIYGLRFLSFLVKAVDFAGSLRLLSLLSGLKGTSTHKSTPRLVTSSDPVYSSSFGGGGPQGWSIL
jgi:hypothetical protein